MRVVIPDWLVADEEIARPERGTVLRNLGLRLRDYEGAIEVPRRLQPIRGKVTWLRYDAANELFEMVIDTGDFEVLTQAFTYRRPRIVLGQTMTFKGRLVGVAAYEYEDFGLPDVCSDWLVESAAQNEETLEWHVDLTPAK